MRLFVAVNFNEEIKNELSNAIEKLKKLAKSGNFTQRENLHLTLAFIGETDRYEAVKKALDEISFNEFEIEINKIGKFTRSGSDLYWAGIEKNEILNALSKNICSSLINSGFKIDTREFVPHLTLGREVIINEDFDKNSILNKSHMKVREFSLMKSEHVKGKLRYTEIYNKKCD